MDIFAFERKYQTIFLRFSRGILLSFFKICINKIFNNNEIHLLDPQNFPFNIPFNNIFPTIDKYIRFADRTN